MMSVPAINLLVRRVEVLANSVQTVRDAATLVQDARVEIEQLSQVAAPTDATSAQKVLEATGELRHALGFKPGSPEPELVHSQLIDLVSQAVTKLLEELELVFDLLPSLDELGQAAQVQLDRAVKDLEEVPMSGANMSDEQVLNSRVQAQGYIKVGSVMRLLQRLMGERPSAQSLADYYYMRVMLSSYCDDKANGDLVRCLDRMEKFERVKFAERQVLYSATEFDNLLQEFYHLRLIAERGSYLSDERIDAYEKLYGLDLSRESADIEDASDGQKRRRALIRSMQIPYMQMNMRLQDLFLDLKLNKYMATQLGRDFKVETVMSELRDVRKDLEALNFKADEPNPQFEFKRVNLNELRQQLGLDAIFDKAIREG